MFTWYVGCYNKGGKMIVFKMTRENLVRVLRGERTKHTERERISRRCM